MSPTDAKAELVDGYASLREQRYGGALALAWQLGRKPLQRELAAFLDVSRSYAASLMKDPVGDLERSRKDRYRGTCERCGGKTDGSAGPGKAPKVCIGCLTTRDRQAALAASPRGPLPRWDEQSCLDSIVRWVERNGRIPRTTDLVLAEPGERPCFGTIIRHCYRYEERSERYREWLPEQTQKTLYWFSDEPRGPWRTRTRRWLTRSLPDILVELAPRFPAAAVVNTRNAWVRARLFEAIGVENIVTSAGEKVAVDEYGTLWRIEQDDWPEPVAMVQVVNSTPEPDGSFKDYFLRVPPTVETPREGIAWTFDVEADAYELAVQT